MFTFWKLFSTVSITWLVLLDSEEFELEHGSLKGHGNEADILEFLQN
jgi:hypothetical protein